MALSKEEVLATAKQLEVDGRTFYLEVAGKTKSELSKYMFESLADDELKHIEWIEKHSTGGLTSKQSNKEMYGRLKKIFADVPEKVREEASATDDDIEAINIALGMEEKSRNEYSRFAKESDDEEIVELFTTLAGIEQFHYDLLQNTKEYFEKTGDWFMVEEGWMFDGG